jgi:hypothetical protein
MATSPSCANEMCIPASVSTSKLRASACNARRAIAAQLPQALPLTPPATPNAPTLDPPAPATAPIPSQRRGPSSIAVRQGCYSPCGHNAAFANKTQQRLSVAHSVRSDKSERSANQIWGKGTRVVPRNALYSASLAAQLHSLNPTTASLCVDTANNRPVSPRAIAASRTAQRSTACVDAVRVCVRNAQFPAGEMPAAETDRQTAPPHARASTPPPAQTFAVSRRVGPPHRQQLPQQHAKLIRQNPHCFTITCHITSHANDPWHVRGLRRSRSLCTGQSEGRTDAYRLPRPSCQVGVALLTFE